MKKTFLYLRTFVLTAFLVTAFACSDDDDGGNNGGGDAKDIVEIAQETPELTALVQALSAAGLVDVLKGDGPFTVLAPNNAAFVKFLNDNGFDSVDDVPLKDLQDLLLNHVISDDLTSGDLSSLGSGYAPTNTDGAGGNKISLYFNTAAGVRFNNASTVIDPDIDASNGTIHIVDAVIPIPNIVDHAGYNSAFNSLVVALGLADGDLLGVLGGDGPFTVLAPDNDAFSDFLGDTPVGSVPKTLLTRTLLNHVVDGAVSSSNLVAGGAGYTNTLVTGPGDGDRPMSLYYNTESGVKFNGISEVTTADIVGTNGIIHAVETVIALPTVVTFAAADPNFSTLAGALDARGFVEILSRTEGDNTDGINPEFTVFAPTNDAFDDLAEIPEGDALDNVLLHHVVAEANLDSSQLPVGDNPATTLQGQSITVTVIDRPVTVTDGSGGLSGITKNDVQADNGVIHVIDRVLIPAANN